MKIDLQIHTNHSDGRETPEQIIKDAKDCNLDIISITDHDIISAIAISTTEAEKVGIKVVPGVEITTGYRGEPIHVLGYCIDPGNQEFKQFLDGINEYRKGHFISLMTEVNKNLSAGGRPQVDIERYKDREAKYYSIPGAALFLYEEKAVEGRNDGFAYIVGLPDAAPTLEPKDAFIAIHKAGGKAFLSHPFAPLISLKNISEDKEEQESIVALFKEQGMDGLECYGTGHAPEDTAFALSLVEKYGLLISAGSDWHGCIEKTGPGLKRYLPFYLDKLGDLAVPEDHIQRILSGLDIHL
jgi:hypothetical protein